MQAKKIITILSLHDFLVKVVTRYIKIRYEKSQNVNFLVLIAVVYNSFSPC